MKIVTLIAALLVGLGAVGQLPAAGQVPDRVGQTESNIAYQSGGIGKDEQEAMLATRKDYNLLLTFANQGTGEYRTDISLLILDVDGKQILSFDAVGPLFHVRLKPGTYRIQASANGKVLAQSAVVRDHGGRELYFYWNPD
jgi:hypothetical protein